MSDQEDTTYSPRVYKQVQKAYEDVTGKELKGNEYGRVRKAIKRMIDENDRTPSQVIGCIQWINKQGYNWTMETVEKKMPDYLAEQKQKKKIEEQKKKRKQEIREAWDTNEGVPEEERKKKLDDFKKKCKEILNN